MGARRHDAGQPAHLPRDGARRLRRRQGRAQEGHGPHRQHVEHRRQARRRARRAAGVRAPARLRRRQPAAADDAGLRELHDAPRRRLGAPPVLAERAPVAHERPRRRARRRAPRRPRAARHDAVDPRQDGPPRAGRPQHLPDGVRLRDEGRPGPSARHRDPAGALADVGRVPRRQGPDGPLVRPVPAARPAARSGARVGQQRAPVRRVLDRAAARRRQGQARGEVVPRRACSRRSEARAACCSTAACASGPASKLISVQRQRPRHGWETIDKLQIDGRSAFTRTIKHPAGSLYRLGYPSPAGPRTTSMAIKPVPAAPRRDEARDDDEDEAEGHAGR